MIKNEKLVFNDIQYIGSGRVSIPDTMKSSLKTETIDGKTCISILDIDRIHIHNPPSAKIPRWWSVSISQAEFIRDTFQSSTIMVLPDTSFLVVGKYSESFFRWVKKHVTQDISYDRFLGGIIIEQPQWPEDTNDALSLHGIQATHEASQHISPMTHHSINLAKYAKKAEDMGYEVPDTSLFPSSRRLMEHQVPVVLSLARRGHGILADDVGSGKSSMFLCGFLSHAQYLVKHLDYDFDEVFPLVVITQKSLLDDATGEIIRWFNNAKVHTIRSKKDYDIDPQAQFIVAPLSSLDRCVDHIISCNPKGCIIDESHMVKSMTAKRTKAAVKLSSYIQETSEHPYLVCASATPIPNRPSEIFSQLVISGMSDDIISYVDSVETFKNRVRPSYRNKYTVELDDNKKFDIRYCAGKTGYFGWDNKGSSNEEELSELLYNNGFIRRRKFEFMTPLPLLHQDFINVSISDEDVARYDRAEEEFKDHLVVKMRELSRKEKWSKSQLRVEIIDKLKKADTSEAIMKMVELRQLVESIKIPGTIRWIHKFFDKDPSIVTKNAKKRKKLIVFAHHKATQKELIEHLELQKYGVLSITSSTKDVQSIVDEFQDWDSGKNLIILYSGAQAGLTLTAASDILILGLPFSYYNVIQMAGRAWARISEGYDPHEAYIHYVNSGLGIDQYMIDLIKKKSWLSKTIIDGQKAADAINNAESEEFDDEQDTTKSILKMIIDR